MKTGLLLLPLAFGLTLGQAQAQTIPNGTLDTWATRNNVEAPANWLNTDDAVAAAPFGALLPTRIQTGTVTKSTDFQQGTFAARLESKTVSVPLLGSVVAPGILALGNKPSANSTYPGGLPFTIRPASMQFYYKLAGTNVASDKPTAAVQLTRTVSGRQEPIATGLLTFTTTADNYTLATVPLVYTSSAAPDSIHIAFASGSNVSITAVPPTSSLTAGTTFLIDNVTMVGVATSNRTALDTHSLNVYPNPSTSGVFALQADEPALRAAPYSILDVTGRVVRTATATSATTAPRTIDLRGQAAGLYTLRLDTSDGRTVVQKLVVE
ncbi:T9SS type A sorting domain-containing protein [Hymenobacter aerilatus]|uniref:T9SS type A sorting domain-containing protein n=1 Tax=Hymenobacter aerilatus TaxID=2932251 RepID=A0A8T9SX60_9BACT|nr:T9SS type A sorting domain-containing protein [Hymenobacter aerilatus]UOR05971.1 T9SS type A sorting domain-containing protein [Hymenobacter aerilatus]